ncbi:DUF3025 domain-containing protein [Comamonas composti]|uniref:DUF3025 domain-containing protein n=1 Tax=Comamonas composti TaxID=408558 RepID=UPI000550B300|nr:DUF3025 domain-containing protein [Comamonas composti]
MAAWLNGLRHAEAPDFVPQAHLPEGMTYEGFIAQTGQVPTRENLHDLFNGLVWLRYPQTKRRLNALHAQALAGQGAGGQRGPVRDAVTLFDESGAVLQAPEPLWQALLARDWQSLFLTRRALWLQAELRVFGHALMEKLLAGRLNATAHVLLAPRAQAGQDCGIALSDEAMAAVLQPQHLALKPFVPLPLAGIPGWHTGNGDADFYAQTSIFRPPRAAGRA